MIEQTLAIIKPDGVARNLVGAVIQRHRTVGPPLPEFDHTVKLSHRRLCLLNTTLDVQFVLLGASTSTCPLRMKIGR